MIEWIQVLHYRWKDRIVDYARLNSAEVEEVEEDLHEFELMLEEETSFTENELFMDDINESYP